MFTVTECDQAAFFLYLGLTMVGNGFFPSADSDWTEVPLNINKTILLSGGKCESPAEDVVFFLFKSTKWSD